MRINYQQFVSRKGTAALALRTVGSDWFGLHGLFVSRLESIAVA
jgi:hypothetical protein